MGVIINLVTRKWSRASGGRQVGGARRRLQRALDHDALADVPQRVGDGARRRVAAEHVAHVLAGRAVAGHVREIPESLMKLCEFLGCREIKSYFF